MTLLERYQQYILSEHWKALRELKFSISGRRCQSCGVMSGLHVHHIRYKNLTDCAPIDLLVLCAECHDILHLMIRKHRLPLEQQELAQVLRIVSDYKASPAYPARKLERQLENKRRQQANIDHPPKHRLTHGEKKMLKKTVMALGKYKEKVDGLKAIIALCQTMIDKRTY